MAERPSLELIATVIDTPDPARLADFYRQLLGWEWRQAPSAEDETWVTLKAPGGGAALSFQLEESYQRPTWPAQAGDQQMQTHLDVYVDDLDTAGAHAQSLGATLADHQPQELVRVWLDPDGHPFCLFVDGG